jgi:hypothetical protein
MLKGAEFSSCKKYRYKLYRIWDETLPLVMFIGLNPSTADENNDDHTVSNVGKIAKSNGYGGFYMMNSFPFISTDPKQLTDLTHNNVNDHVLLEVSSICKDVVFSWGSFKVMNKTGRDQQLKSMFPNPKVLKVNKDGSPKHPLYCSSKSILEDWIF